MIDVKNFRRLLINAVAVMIIHTFWISFFGIILYIMLAIGLSNVIICSLFPLMMFYALWWGYDRTERYICRKLGVVLFV